MSGNPIERFLYQNARIARSPISATVELISACNLHCDMCYIEHHDRKQYGRSTEEWKTLARKLAEAGVLFVTLSGGEPLLHPDFQEIYLAFQEQGMILTLNTNGTLIDEAMADFLARYAPRRINLTLYGTDADTYEQLCHLRSGYERATRGIRLLVERGLPLKLNASIVRANAAEINEIYDFAEELGLTVHADTYMLPGHSAMQNTLTNPARREPARQEPEDAARSEILCKKRELGDHYDEYIQDLKQKLQHPDQYRSGCVDCQAARTSFALDEEGYMNPCVTMRLHAFSVPELGIEEAWKQMLHSVDQQSLHERCLQCPYRGVCNTCIASAWYECGDASALVEYHCRYTEALLKELDLI